MAAVPMPNTPLTAIEREVLRLVADGLTNKEIAATVLRSEGTIKDCVQHICTRMEAVNRTHAVKRGFELGYLRASDSHEPSPLSTGEGGPSMIKPIRGEVYDVGGALAVFWPDVHPCTPYRPQWVVLTQDGDIAIVHRDLPREDMTPAHSLGLIVKLGHGWS